MLAYAYQIVCKGLRRLLGIPNVVRRKRTLRKLDHDPFCLVGTAAPSWPLLELMVYMDVAVVSAKEFLMSGRCYRERLRRRGVITSQWFLGGSRRNGWPA